MSRRWFRLLALAAVLAIPGGAHAQVDLDALRRGVAGCPEIAADPNMGNLGAFLCRPQDRTNLDAPINQTGTIAWEVRAGSFHPYTRPSLLASARGALGDAEFARLQDLLLDAQVLSRSLEALRLALLAEGDTAGAEAILGSPEDVFDANIPALLATRPDRDRYADWRSGLLHSLGARDSVSQYDQAFAETLATNVGGLPNAVDAEGIPVYTAANAQRLASPIFLGPDGVRDTFDDLPFVVLNAQGQAAGYALASPLQGAVGTPDNSLASFDGTFGRNRPGDMLRPIYSATAQALVLSAADPVVPKLVELYGVYSDAYLIRQGCQGFGTYDTATGACMQEGVDVSAEALEQGCGAIVRLGAFSLRAGQNADGDCIEVNTISPAPGSLLQFEVIGLLGDPNARPPQATLEPVDLTDLRMVVDFGELNTLPARPRAYGTGNVSFPVSTPTFRRSVDLLTGAPIAPESSACRIREDAVLGVVGPNGIAGDGDDVLPSQGFCLLWNVPDSDVQPLQMLTPAEVAWLHTVNQTLFHTLCTLSYDADGGACELDELNQPQGFGFVSLVLSGLGVLAGPILYGVDTIVPVQPDGGTSVIQRGWTAATEQMLLPIEPLALQDHTFQDLGFSLRSTSAALLGCGPGYASPCSLGQQTAWSGDAALVAALTRLPAVVPTQAGGIDLMNADASVLLQEFAVVKQRKSGELVGTTLNQSGQLVYLPGVNFSRTGQQAMDVDQDFDRSGVQLAVPDPIASLETGDFLSLTPTDVVDLGEIGRAEYQAQAGNLREADGWVEGMPWTVDQDLLDRFGAIVFNADPNNPLDLDSPRNEWKLIDGNGSREYSNVDGEYCARWMTGDTSAVATPFNLGCTALETVSANFERVMIALEVIGQDRVFDAPESLAELVAMLDGDPSNDATGDPIAGPDGIFARNQFVISDEEMDFEVVAGSEFSEGDYTYIQIAIGAGESPHEAAARTLLEFDPQADCSSTFCYLDVDNVLVDSDDARPLTGRTMILAMPVGMSIDVVVPVDPNDPNSDSTPIGLTKVNLAALQFSDLPTLRRLLAGQVIALDTPVGTQFVRMSTSQRSALLGGLGSGTQTGRDMDADSSADLDRNRDAVWDGQDDYTSAGPSSDDSVVCGSGVPGDLLQEGVQYSPYRADEKPGQPSFEAAFPDGLPPRSPVFCRELTSLLGLAGPLRDAVAGQSDAFLWHGGLGAPGTDDDEDGFPDVVDNCATIANATQGDLDTDGVGDECDNCAAFPNPRVADDFLAANPWAIATGGQRDDDRDGFGNLCDADFTMSGAVVGGLDLGLLRSSLGRSRATATCGASGDMRCAIFDLDQTGDDIDANDLARFRELQVRVAGPKCPTCPLVCESGDPANCD